MNSIVTFDPPGISYELLKPGDIYERRGELWIVAPDGGDFYIRESIIWGKFASNKPEGEMVKPMGRLRFHSEQKPVS